MEAPTVLSKEADPLKRPPANPDGPLILALELERCPAAWVSAEPVAFDAAADAGTAQRQIAAASILGGGLRGGELCLAEGGLAGLSRDLGARGRATKWKVNSHLQ